MRRRRSFGEEATFFHMLSVRDEPNILPDNMNSRSRLLDLLAEPTPYSPGIRRDGNDFVVDMPWSLVRYGQVKLRRGWWIFECEGEGDVGGVELQLVSPEDSLMAFSLRRNAEGQTLFRADKTFDVSLLVSAWPGRIKLRMLRLRRLSILEEARLAGALLVRLGKSDRPFSKLLHIATRMVSGRSLRIRAAASLETRPRPLETSSLSEGALQSVVSGGVTAVLREGERLHPRAFEIVAGVFARSPTTQAAYADLSEAGRILPRPEWDADLAAVTPYAGPPMFFRGKVEAIDAWTRLLSLSKDTGAIARIPLPLGLRETVIGIPLVALPAPKLSSSPLVSVVIPTKYRLDLLERCLQGLVDRTNYPALEIIVVNGSADHRRVEEVIAKAAAKVPLRRVDDYGAFNFSRLINLGVRNSQGDVVLLLNDDIEAVEAGWLNRMVQSATTEGVGCVGARLLYPDRTIQHAGVTLGISGVCGHLWKGLSPAEAAAIPQVVLPSQRMAVTGACLAVRRDLFDRVGGLDEIRFPVAFNDVDFCLRIRELGYRTIYRGDAALIHHESQSRGPDDATMESRKRLARETAAFLDRWRPLLLDDPFGSPAFDPLLECGSIHPSLREQSLDTVRPSVSMPRRVD
jgi:GT2 family glycosyltransferase